MATSPVITGSTIQAVRDHCGADIANRLVDHFGGRLLAVPHKPPRRGRLATVLDPADLQRLCTAVGGEAIVVPIGPRSALRRMRRRVERMVRAGRSASDTAHRAGCCIRTVYVIKAEMRAAGELKPGGQAV